MTFFGDIELLHQMQQSAADDVFAKWRPQSEWLGRDSEYLDDPEENDPCESVHSFVNRLQEEYSSLVVEALEAEEEAESRWYRQLSYQEFLMSDYWDTVVKAVRLRDGNRCHSCGSAENLQVHHRWYPERGTELQNLDALVILCAECHRREHH